MMLALKIHWKNTPIPRFWFWTSGCSWEVTENDSANLLELIHKRRKPSSTIFCSQYLEENWYQKLGGTDNPLTDAIMDRISFDSYKIPIMSLDPEKDISMREVYGLDPSQAQ